MVPRFIWQDVTISSAYAKAYDSTNLTDGADTTQQLGGGTFVTDNNGVCEDGRVGVVVDPDLWTQATTPSFSTSAIFGVTYGNGLFVAVGGTGKIAYSSNGDLWTQAATPSFSTTGINCVTYGGGLYVAGGASGKIAYSSDADAWTQATTPSFGTDTSFGIAYNNDLFVAVGNTGKIASTDALPTNATAFGASDEAEYEFTIELVTTDWSAGDIVRFRIKGLDSYTDTAAFMNLINVAFGIVYNPLKTFQHMLMR